MWFESYDSAWPEMKPIKSVIPQWYKDAERFTGGKPVLVPFDNTALKLCTPFLDSLTSGYFIPLFQDVLVEQTPHGPLLSFRTSPAPISERETFRNKTLPTPEGYWDKHYMWNTQTSFKLPNGYSALVVHPLNRMDLPFFSLSAVVDANFAMNSGSLPFFLSKNFEGIIPQGTPIAQIIPFKREDWELQKKEGLVKEAEITQKKAMSVVSGWYKNNFWNRKSYE